MAHRGQLIVNPFTGEYAEFVETVNETMGSHTSFKVLQKSNGFKPVMHLHLRQDEIFTVLEGELTYILNSEKKEIKKGESIILPKGHAHTHYNNGSRDLLLLQTITPSLDADLYVENFFGLVAEGKMPKGQPAFLQIMVWGKTLQSKTYLASVPVPVQNTLAYILSPFARMLGYKAAYKRFSGFDA